MRVIENIKIPGTTPTKSAAMYYKTEPFIRGVGDYHHTNNWEILRAVEIICSKGYSVDVIDRGNNNWVPNKKYDLFLGLGVGNTGDKFARYAKLSGAEKRVLLAMGPQPDISNQRTLQRYDMFNERTGQNAPAMRTVTRVVGEVFEEIIENVDYIFCIGEKGTKSHNSFLRYDKPILNFYPAITSKVHYDASWLNSRKRNEFLCFAGNGLICKGVDLVLEAFLGMPSNILNICGPPESAFMDQYAESMRNSKNIFYHGFIEPGGPKFNDLASRCSYTIFHAASEGCCTSVATAMKAGLVPIVNPWTGILIEDNLNGIILPDNDPNDIIKTIREKVLFASSIKEEKYSLLVKNNNNCIDKYSQKGYIRSYEDCIDRVIN